MKEFKIFYSWQSDLPNSTNRGFIQDALDKTAKALSLDNSFKIEPVIERDTKGIPGSPDISSTILKKIDEADVFVADVSIIAGRWGRRPTPNPNVIFELGYALRRLSQDRIIMVMNIDFGSPELLPFDLKLKKVVGYSLDEKFSKKISDWIFRKPKGRSYQKKLLATSFENGLREILSKAKPLIETRLPKIRWERANLAYDVDSNGSLKWNFTTVFFIETPLDKRFYFPLNFSIARFSIPEHFKDVVFSEKRLWIDNGSLTIKKSQDDLIVEGPGKFFFSGSTFTDKKDMPQTIGKLHINLKSLESGNPVVFDWDLPLIGTRQWGARNNEY